ncbi:CoF synthetase [Candidatus Gottesmanbacteria bacterium]|nr:CoF synthetase [Candidatus Gottesmanbacteria bacterium]
MKQKIIFSFLKLAKIIRNLSSSSDKAYKLLFTPGFENFRWMIGKWKAWQVFEHAKTTTPAYKDFLVKHPKAKIIMSGWNPDLSSIPVMDKESYIKKYSIESRCINGLIPSQGVVIDESSGTSGTPNNWVRGPKERADVKKALQVALHFHFGDKPIFIINAFALGPWATGMNVSMSLVDISVLKSTGPDIKKIENTLNFFGPKYNYVIMGYPPFLKSLVDSTTVDWKKFKITAVFGGEGMSEGMRTYLNKVFQKCYGSYGASDLEINIAAENDFTIALRQLLIENKELTNKIIKNHNSSIPMIFQYNPLDYFIENNDSGELIVTLCRLANVSPKIRYNIHDTGHVLRFSQLKKILDECKIKIADICKEYSDLPLLFHYGRADMAVAFYGCKITPSDIQEIIYNNPDLAKIISSFSLITSEDENANKKLTLALEMAEGKELIAKNIEMYREEIFEHLKIINQDYREASKMIPKGFEPGLEFYAFGAGPFATNDIRLKKHYIQNR